MRAFCLERFAKADVQAPGVKGVEATVVSYAGGDVPVFGQMNLVPSGEGDEVKVFVLFMLKSIAPAKDYVLRKFIDQQQARDHWVFAL